MTPRLEACYFAKDPGVASQMERMARVLEYSAEVYCPGWAVHVRRLPAERRPSQGGRDAHVANTQKLDYWSDVVQHADDGECILLMDTDTFITRPLDALWEMSFDLVYTLRDSFMYPFNGGVIALRVSPSVKTFIARWADENRAMLSDQRYRQEWSRQFGGINQASFGRLLALHDASPLAEHLHLETLACVEWNCEESAWRAYDPALTRIVHVKSRLRRAVFASARDSELTPLVVLWKNLEASAISATMARASQSPSIRGTLAPATGGAGKRAAEFG